MKKYFLCLTLLLLLLTGCGIQNAESDTPPVQEVEHEVPPPPEIQPEPIPEPVPVPEPDLPVEPVPSPETEVTPEPDPVPEADSTPEVEPAPEVEPEQSSTTLPILMYHHVVPDGTECNDMTVTTGKLEKDLQWLQDHGYETILSYHLLPETQLPEKAVLITFDDGYRSNYELAFPLLQQYQSKAVISIMTDMPYAGITTFLSWDMCREMAQSGLVEIGSHTHQLHNLDGRGGNFTPGGINGIQRNPQESDESFRQRVLDDIQLSYDLISLNIGQAPAFFAYPFGIREPDAQELIDSLFPVTVITATGHADLSSGPKNLTRWTVTMNTDLSSILTP